jgi:uncharacterized protein (TIGR03084 family)
MLATLIGDLAAEHHALETLVTGFEPGDWERETPSPGWQVRDHIAHLAHFDLAAALAITDAARFAEDVADAMRDVPGYEARYLDRGRARRADGLLAWWSRARRRLLDAAACVDERTRVPWYGPPMSAASFVSARLMETWLHGHDVVDALAIDRQETDRVRHIAFLGVRTRAFSYLVRGLAPRADPVRVELVLPSGASWIDGDERASDRIAGSAVDFCRVVTHRRHVADTALTVDGEAAADWMRVAQAFAGPPGRGRSPGAFRKPPR